MIVTRFAPSPTGFLHIGNARPALWNWLIARRAGGRFMLRLDDTDRERSEARFEEGIADDLAWLGLDWDLRVRQSDRVARYAEALEGLKAKGLVYSAYETAEELDRKRKRQQLRGLPPVYDRAALALSDAERRALEAEGRRPHWRFRLSGQEVTWRDGVRGESRIQTASLSDPVLVREDGTVLYAFASVVDDMDMGVTDIVRGEDHVANTAVQIELFAALGATTPRFAHQNLIVSATGEEMSKRTGALSLRSFREAGAEPGAVAAVAVLTGTSEPVRPVAHARHLMDQADLSVLSRSLTRFDPADIALLTAKITHHLEPAEAMARIGDLGLGQETFTAFWLALRGNLANALEAARWRDLVFAPMAGTVDAADRDYLETAASLLPDPLSADAWPVWTGALKAATGRKGKPLFMPLRLALTGLEHGPELAPLLPLMGRDRVVARLRGQSA
jgi:glutamyl-tRNA synthetase